MTLELLDYLLEIERRRVFATLAYPSLYQYVVEELGYSKSQAIERVNAMRLMPEADAIPASDSKSITSIRLRLGGRPSFKT